VAEKVIAAVMVVAVVAVLVGMIAALPTLQSSQDKLDSQAAEAIAFAHRALTRYSENQVRSLLARQQLELIGAVTTQPAPEQTNQLVQDMMQGDDAQRRERFGDLRRRLSERTQLEERILTLDKEYRAAVAEGEGDPPIDPATLSMPQTLGAVQEFMREAETDVARRLRENEELLVTAKDRLQAVLSTRVGDVSGNTHVGANAALAAVLYQEAMTMANRALVKRTEANRTRGPVMLTAWQIRRSMLDEAFWTAMRPTAPIAKATQNKQLADEQVRAARQRVEELTTRIEQMTEQREAALAKAAEANAKLEKLARDLFDVTRPAAFKAWAEQYLTHAATAREAEQRADRLMFGTLAGATLDDQYGKDPLRDAYVGGTPTPGIQQLKDDLSLLKRQIDGQTAGLLPGWQQVAQRVDANLATLKSADTEIAGRLSQIEQETTARQTEARSDRDTAQRLVSEAEVLEADAIALLQDAEQRLSNALNQLQTRARDVDARLTRVGSEKPNDRLILRKTYFVEQRARVQSLLGDVERLIGAIYHQQVADLQWHRAMAADAAGAGISQEITVETIDTKIASARTAGIEALQKAAAAYEQAAGLLLRGSGAAYHKSTVYAWTAQVNAAVTYYLMGLLDAPAEAAGHVAKARDLLDQALAGKANSPLLSTYVKLLEHLTARAG